MADITPMQSVQDKVRERITAQFMELVPDELLAQLTQSAIDAWVKVELPKLVNEIMREKAGAVVREYFAGPGWQETWNNGAMQLGPMTADALRAAAPDLVASMFSQVFTNFIQQARYQAGR